MHDTWAEWLIAAMESIRAAGPVGCVLFVLLYVLLGALFLPASILTVGAGAIYGWGAGTLLVSFASTVGAALNFFTSRYLARAWIERRLESRPRFRSLAHAISARGWPLIMLSRLSPIFPHSIVSYAAGITRIGALRFMGASFLGFLPLSAAYAYAGTLVGRLAALRAGTAEQDPLASGVWIAGLAFTVVVTVLGARLVAKAFRDAERESPTDS